MPLLIYRNKNHFILKTEEIEYSSYIEEYIQYNKPTYPIIEILEKKKTMFFIEENNNYKTYIHENNEILPI